jgi:hypothetical protein
MSRSYRNKGRYLGVLIVTLAAVVSIAAQRTDDRKFETGEWSAVVGGLRGRLLAAPGGEFIGTRMVDVYLELQNVSDVGNPMEIYFNSYDSIKSVAVDSAGKDVKQPANAASITSPGPYWLSVPWDGTLRFRVSVSGYGVYKNSGTQVQMDSGNWLIALSDKAKYYLEAKFSSLPAPDKRRAWEGTLILPKVLIPHQ